MIRSSNLLSRWRATVGRLVLLAVGLILAGQIWAAPAQATGIYDMPTLTAGEPTWVIDQADLLSRINQGKLSKTLETLASETGSEVRFVTIHRLDYGETVSSFTDQLFEKWFSTPEAQANQAVLVLDNVTNDAALRVGESAKALLTDEISASVVQETLMVPLRDGNKYNQALLDVSDRLVAVLSGEPDPGPPIVENTIQTEGTFATAEETDDSNATVIVIGFLIAATVIPMATYYLYQVMQS